jgi:rod shape-determining protein MreC
VAFREGPFGDLKVPLTWTAAVALVVAVVVAGAILLADRRQTVQTQAYGVTRQAVDKVAAPVGGVLSWPGRATGQAVDYVKSYFFVASENRRLKAQLVEAQEWQTNARKAQGENERFRALLGLKLDPPIPMVAARVVSESRGPFANSRLADVGTDQQVSIGNPVMSERGLLGRVVGVSSSVSRVLMLTDVESKTPVMIARTNARAILTGDGGPNPKLEYLRGRDPVKAGDQVVTSGDGGVVPRGLPVGVAVQDMTGEWRVTLASDSAPIDYVRVLRFTDFSKIAAAATITASTMPPVTTEDPQGAILNAPTAAAAPATTLPAKPTTKPVVKPPANKPSAKPTAPARARQ